MAHNWIIDLQDESMKCLFNPEEWEEITQCVPKLPTPDVEFARYLSRFHDVWLRIQDAFPAADNAKVRTTAKLREVLENTSYRPPGKTYNRDEHFDLEWADAVLRGLYVILEPAMSSREITDCFLSSQAGALRNPRTTVVRYPPW
jgi:hypothetical protein